MRHRLVLDTNVLVAGLRSRRGASYRLLRLTDDDISAILDDLCALGEWHVIRFLWRPALRDPGDEMVLETAVAAQCPCIVTHNIRDFGGAERFGVTLFTPRDWLLMRGEER